MPPRPRRRNDSARGGLSECPNWRRTAALLTPSPGRPLRALLGAAPFTENMGPVRCLSREEFQRIKDLIQVSDDLRERSQELRESVSRLAAQVAAVGWQMDESLGLHRLRLVSEQRRSDA
jgi:hypothetical protein